MNIRLRTGGLLGQYLPPGGERNRAQLEVPDESTPADYLRQQAAETITLVITDSRRSPVEMSQLRSAK